MKYYLTLYVTGETPNSQRAIANLEKLSEECDADEFDIQIIDLLKHPDLAAEDEIIAVPTLVKKLPKPMQKIVGDLSNCEEVLLGLQVVSNDIIGGGDEK
jgi:circadian clock protein KaiB